MKTLLDRDRLLGDGLAAIRRAYQVPEGFDPAVRAAAEAVAARGPIGERVDHTGRLFVTLDPASATDLDQAFAIEPAAADLILRYAIADVGAFVAPGDALDRAAWTRGETLYLPDGKASLYPPVLSEGAASLLPGGPRAAAVFAVRVTPDGAATLDGAERAWIRSRAKLAYETVRPADLPPGFADLSARVQAAEAARGAARVDPPEQEVARGADGRLALGLRPRLPAEANNAALSLAANLAVAQALLVHGTGLFRVMAEPDDHAVARLRHTAEAFALAWPAAQSLADFTRTLDPADPRQGAFMLAVRRAGDGARYAPFRTGETPWHAALAASYAQATAPLRRLADRYVVEAALAVANGRAVPEEVSRAFEQLPPVMARADARAGQVDRAVIDLAEAALLAGREGETFAAVVTDADERGARIQLSDLPVVARVDARALPGDALTVRLDAADPATRTLRFSAAGTTPPASAPGRTPAT